MLETNPQASRSSWKGEQKQRLRLSTADKVSQPDTPPEALVETLSILSILISRFPSNLSNASLNPPPLTVLAPLLQHARPVVRKKAIATLAQFVPISKPELFSNLLKTYVTPSLAPGANVGDQRTTVQLIAAVARYSPLQISSVLGEIAPGILKAIQKDDDELREGCLQVIERRESTHVSDC